jgi:hypothetical protein
MVFVKTQVIGAQVVGDDEQDVVLGAGGGGEEKEKEKEEGMAVLHAIFLIRVKAIRCAAGEMV